MKTLPRALVPSVLAALVLAPGAASGQTHSSLGLGVAVPTGDFGDDYDPGATLRGQVGMTLGLLDAHVQAGWTRFQGGDATSGGFTTPRSDISVYHAGVGARVGLGPVWVGANAAYFLGDGDDGPGFFPEAGTQLGPVEAVLDYRIDGDSWLGARVALRF